MRFKKQLGALAVLGLVGAFALAAPGNAGTKNGGTSSRGCGDNGTLSYAPTTLWPPNHKSQAIAVTYTDPDAEHVSLSLTTNPHNEIVDDEEINGTGNTPAATDSTPNAGAEDDNSITVIVTARAERSGHKNAAGGRVYEFDYVASSTDDGMPGPLGMDGCESNPGPDGDGLLVTVPHDQGNHGA